MAALLYKWVGDVGITGADKSTGGKYLILPPSYKSDVPPGYHVVRPTTFGSYLDFRAFGDPRATRAFSVTSISSDVGSTPEANTTLLSFRAVERAHDFHVKLHEFTDQLERLLMAILLVLLGGAITAGGLLKEVTWPVVLFASLALFVVRPAVAYLSLLGRAEPVRERLVISFFGIRGLGSVYYLAYGLGHATFHAEGLLWSTVTLVIVASIFIHGVTVTPIMRFLDAEGSQSKQK